jgi:glycine dehydrogenase subunit 1
MPFIPHTPEDVSAMLDAIGVGGIDNLFDEIPAELLNDNLPRVPDALNEMQIMRLMTERAEANGRYLSFLGAGAYEHHIPAAVWQLATRGEFYTSYTPYQAEASQGTLQLLYEWQTMMASLTGMDVSNASLYDGATAFSEAVLMAVRANRNDASRVLVPSSLHPHYRATLKTIVGQHGIAVVEVPFYTESGRIDQDALEAAAAEPFAALAIAQPNFFGVLEEPDALTDKDVRNGITGRGLEVIFVVNPDGSYYVFMVSMLEAKSDGNVDRHQLNDIAGILANIYANTKITF